jgi:flagellar biosynthetic protein FlhB
MAEDDSKTEEPTQRKLDKTREEGQFARSQDLSVALLTIAVACILYFIGADIGSVIITLFQESFSFDARVITDKEIMAPLFASIGLKGLIAISPILISTVFLAFGAAFLVGGVGFSIKGFSPKGSKLNPLNGLKRMFGLKSLVELIKGILKLILIGAIIAAVVVFNFDSIFTLSILDPLVAPVKGLSILATGVLLISVSLLIIAAIDVPFQIVTFKNKLKMSIQEIKDEMKESDGRPEVKSKIRQKQREIAMGQMLEAISEADVIVTNPTHFAVALSYAVGSDEAPKVIAKGADFMAQRIREKGEEFGISLFEEPELARALFFTTEINQSIPRQLFEAVAEVIAYVYQLNSFDGSARKAKKPRINVPPEMSFDELGKQLDDSGSL